MSLYTTGEIAKLCNVSVRTVQYYDTRNILKPSSLSEGGRRLYSEEDVERMKTICFLREVGISINNIEALLVDEEPDKIVSILIEQQEKILSEEIKERQLKLEHLTQMKQEMKKIEHFSVESINDIAYVMENKKNMRKIHMRLLIFGIPCSIFEWISIIYGFVTGNWWPALGYLFLGIPFGFLLAYKSFKYLVYICPICHTVFKPVFKEVIFADHTPTLRKLTCTCCGYHGFCVETYGKEKN